VTTELGELFNTNREWAAATERRTPGFFTRLQEQQAPQYLWIGCADSRVPANDIVGLLPGELFVHRNVANVVVHSDLNCLSVIQFAIDLLQVKHIIVVGHYGCSGVRAALEDRRIGLADNWLRHVQDVRNKHRMFIESLPDDEMRLRALCELNVLEQALNVCETTVIGAMKPIFPNNVGFFVVNGPGSMPSSLSIQFPAPSAPAGGNWVILIGLVFGLGILVLTHRGARKFLGWWRMVQFRRQ